MALEAAYQIVIRQERSDADARDDYDAADVDHDHPPYVAQLQVTSMVADDVHADADVHDEIDY